MFLTIDVSYAGFAKFSVAMTLFWWLDMWQVKLNPKIFEITEVKLSFSTNILHFRKVLFKETMMAIL